MADNLLCPICGEHTYMVYGKNPRKDRLCGKHATELKNGNIVIVSIPNFDDSQTVFADAHSGEILNKDKTNIPSSCYQQEYKTGECFCVVCGAKTKYRYKQCTDCYQETREYMGGLDKNSTISELRQYYYNLKDYIFRMKDIEKIKTNCNKLIAIAIVNDTSNNDNALLERVYKDVQELIERKQKYMREVTVDQTTVQAEKTKEAQVHFNYSTDGHALDSDMEVKIDDILYASEIFHCCHKPVTDITEKSVVSDWFIPIDSINKGIYIEYNGMDTPKYKKNKDENVSLYHKHNLPLIIIEKDEPKNDTQTFTAHLIKEIQSKAFEFFGGMPKWRK